MTPYQITVISMLVLILGMLAYLIALLWRHQQWRNRTRELELDDVDGSDDW